MTKRKVTHYPAEFKESSAKLAIDSLESIAQIAKNLDIHVPTLHGSFQEGLKQLRKENAYAHQESDILTKAAVYFAGEIRSSTLGQKESHGLFIH